MGDKMISFFVLNGANKRECHAIDAGKAASIISLVFPNQKAYVVDNGKIAFAHNLSIEEAETLAGIAKPKMDSMTNVPPAPSPKKAAKVKAKPKKKAVKKTVLKSKVKIKNNKKPVKKTVVKSKVKPKVKAKPKAKVKTVKKGKSHKRG